MRALKPLLLYSGIKMAQKHQPKWSLEARFLCPSSGIKFCFADLDQRITGKRLVILGENHAQPEIVQLELSVLDVMAKSLDGTPGQLNVIMEHFPIDGQGLINDYMSDEAMDFEQFYEAYQTQTKEGHQLDAYEPLLAYVKTHPEKIALHAGFPPRAFSRIAISESWDSVAEQAKDVGYLHDLNELVPGSELHYQFFEGLISDQPFHSSDPDSVQGSVRKIFPAQVLKDSIMASRVVERMRKSTTSRDKFLVICGNGHCEYGFGVPERIAQTGTMPPEDTFLLTVRSQEEYREVTEFGKNFEAYKNEGLILQPADAIFFFSSSDEDPVKTEIANAYDKVGSTAHKPGNLRKARHMMKLLGYQDSQIEAAGEDIYNFQGVGNPHKHADLRADQQILDIGSGLGVDAFIAGHAVWPNGRVIGIDISRREITHASERASVAGLDHIKFLHGDMERIPLEDASVDRVISNGAFCLAPNKEKAFREVHRVLKSGGRFSVACTTLLTDHLDDKVQWPVCMRVFMPLAEVKGLLYDIGFTDLVVDMSDSKMSLEMDPEFQEDQPTGEVDQRGRKRIHFGSEQFKHLQDMDMDKICARVVIAGKKEKKLSPDSESVSSSI